MLMQCMAIKDRQTDRQTHNMITTPFCLRFTVRVKIAGQTDRTQVGQDN